MSTVQIFGDNQISSGRDLNVLGILSTFLIVAGAFVSLNLIEFETGARNIIRTPAWVMLFSLGFAGAVELRAGIKNLIRVDWAMFSALYILVFIEFLFPSEIEVVRFSDEHLRATVRLILLSFCGLALGRLFPIVRRGFSNGDHRRELNDRHLFLVLLGSTFFGYLYMWIAVDFNFQEWLFQLSQPRFTQSWTRGRLGSISSILTELSLLIYLVPPICGVIFARWRRYSIVSLGIALFLFLLVVYVAFAVGTRNVLLTYIVTFAAGWTVFQPKLSIFKTSIILGPFVLFAAGATYYLPEIRNEGLANFDLNEIRTDELFIDMNALNLAGVVHAFPRQYDYVGAEIPITAIIRPIPRALWSSKPEGLSITIEEAVGIGSSNVTLSTTYIGEVYMAGGAWAVGVASLIFGILAGFWNRLGRRANNGDDLILFICGFFFFTLLMRSFLSSVPLILPAVLFAVYVKMKRTISLDT